jgi:hypothetical protein
MDVGNTDISNFYTPIKNRYGRIAGNSAETLNKRIGDLSLVAQMSKFGHRITPSRSGSFG